MIGKLIHIGNTSPFLQPEKTKGFKLKSIKMTTTEYEKKRLENIAKNRLKLKELEIDFERSLVSPTDVETSLALHSASKAEPRYCTHCK